MQRLYHITAVQFPSPGCSYTNDNQQRVKNSDDRLPPVKLSDCFVEIKILFWFYRTLLPYRCCPAPLRIISPLQQDSGTARGDQSSRQQGSMATTGQQQGGSLRSRRGVGRDKDPAQDMGTDAACCVVPGVLRRLIELPSPPLSRHQLKRLEEHR